MSEIRPDPLSALSVRARKLGFTAPHVARLSDIGTRPGARLQDFVAQGRHGTMAWMEATLERRGHPNTLWPEGRSAVVLGLNYGPETDPLITLEQTDRATISVYARNRDYHDVMKGRLKELAGLLARDTGQDVKVFVDTAPLMEKPLAAAAGLGWQGKHTNLLSREWGNWLFIGTILSAAELEPTLPEADHCGTCRACLDACPTDAFPAPYQLDARRCISYLTIEHEGPVDEALRPLMGNRIYGCDDCLAVCPWNKFAQAGREAKLAARNDLDAPALADLAALGDAGFRSHFAGSPIKRIGWPRFLRNVLYAIGNSGTPALIEVAGEHTHSDVEVVRNAAEWACNRLSRAN
ncbi:tRNA epoxyqueuosine(34) reductase QueG [uncultured Algimonas sp.]|uniref:tRNA epoxyqueuosine(34) reductase QueG n=1 Tax=uncultured Algimonas sp. TaxID=1547920 RepID=UPI002617E91F|nr:tRNA epoxyqueuosine(34) reductase QueG [uncultured Algimonas sp.]